ncbi:MAG TPA: hypothetical protein PKB06_10650, partial [Actinotalea sp.]|nr:hypothetical protein [Actinotalea sp.]
MTTLLIALAAAVALGLLLHVVDGRFRPARGTAPEAGAGDPFLRALPGLGEHATFVQISAESCAVCPRVAGVLAGVAGATRGVRHVELR